MKLKLQLRHRAIGITAVAMTSSLLLVVIFIVPIVSTIIGGSAEIRDLQAQLLVKKRAAKEIRTALEQFRAAKAEVQNLQTVFLKSGEELRLITALEGIADATTLAQRIDISPGTTAGKDFKILPVTMNLRGDALAIVRYLSLLPTLPLYVTVRSVALSADASGGISATVRASAYIR